MAQAGMSAHRAFSHVSAAASGPTKLWLTLAFCLDS